MKTILLALFISLNLLNPNPLFARGIINPDRADTSYPENVDDINNHVVPQESFNSHTQTIDITNSFDPNTASPSASPVPYDVNQIMKEQDPKAHTLLKSFNEYTSNSFLNPLVAVDKIKKVFFSLNLNNSTGASNMAQKALPYKSHQCLASHRLIQAVNTLDPEFRSDTTLDTKITLPDRKIRLSQLAYILKDQPIFYDTRLPCNSKSAPTTLLTNPSLTDTAKANFASKASNSILSLDEAKKVFSLLAPTSDTDSAQQKVIVYVNKNGTMEKDAEFDVNQPGAGGLNKTSDGVYGVILPHNAKVIEHDYSKTSDKLSANQSDTTNEITFIARVIKFFGTIFDKSETYSGSTQIVVQNPSQVEKSSDTAATAIRHLLPAKESKKLDNTPGSYKTEGSDISSPGQPAINSLDALVRNLQPASWQKTAF